MGCFQLSFLATLFLGAALLTAAGILMNKEKMLRTVNGDTLDVKLPAKSVVVLALK